MHPVHSRHPEPRHRQSALQHTPPPKSATQIGVSEYKYKWNLA
jgi:hypothetical protein